MAQILRLPTLKKGYFYYGNTRFLVDDRLLLVMAKLLGQPKLSKEDAEKKLLQLESDS